MSAEEYARFGEMKMIMHHIYEFKKGIRGLILCTLCKTYADIIIKRLQKQGIEYITQNVGDRKVNLYFGKRACLDAVSRFIDKPLNLLTPEEDFMLGAMLGYDITLQCERFCSRKAKMLDASA
jgi:Protein of unknown function (DUF2023).